MGRSVAGDFFRQLDVDLVLFGEAPASGFLCGK